MSTEVQQTPIAVSDKEGARLLGISRSTLRSRIKRGDIPVAKIGRRVLVPVASLQAFLHAAVALHELSKEK